MERGTYTVTATGNTFECKESLKEWGFKYNSEKKSWTRESATAGEVSLFKRCVSDGTWDGVELDIVQEAQA